MLGISIRFRVWLVAHFILTLDELRIKMVATYITRYQLSSSCHFFHKDEVSCHIFAFLVFFNTNPYLFLVDSHSLHAREDVFVSFQLLSSVKTVRDAWTNTVEPLVILYLGK